MNDDGLNHGTNEPSDAMEPMDPELAKLERQLRSLRPRDLTPGMRQRMRELLGASSFGLVGGGRGRTTEGGPLRWLGWALPLAAVLAIAFVMFRESPQDAHKNPDDPGVYQPLIVDKGAHSPRPLATDFTVPAPSIARYRQASLHSEEALDELLTQHGRSLLTPVTARNDAPMASQYQDLFDDQGPKP